MRKTKIVCTLGPACDDPAVLRRMAEAGMNVARLNFSHGSYDSHREKIEKVKKLRDEMGIPLAIMLDTKGPEIRIGRFENGSAELVSGQSFILTSEQVEGNGRRVSVSYAKLHEALRPGDRVMVNDGAIELRVESIADGEVLCRVVNGGVLTDRKSINLPDTEVPMPYIGEADRRDLLFGVENGVDYIAASFVRTAQDVLDVRRLLEENGAPDIEIIAKIENAQGVANIDEILRVSDGIMVARGDMGVEIDFEELPAIQKRLIHKCYTAGKRVITATQMLESMISNPRPTRAETSDVANAVYDGTSAVMLSGESAVGQYPVEAVRAMARISEQTEGNINYIRRFKQSDIVPDGIPDAIAHATCTTAQDLNARAIIVVTQSGGTARMVSKFRPTVPIVAATTTPRVFHQLALSWGVYPVMAVPQTDTDALFDHAVECAVRNGFVENGDITVITAGMPLGVSGTTNTLKVHIVGKVLVSGAGISNQSLCGQVCVCATEEEVHEKAIPGRILVVNQTTNTMMQELRKAAGIICEESGQASHAAVVGHALGIPVITGARGATRILKDGITVTMDSGRGLVYSGSVQTAAAEKKSE
ncbi:MAG: pyruvate kinase [Clostridia bacterium]|nr:pyruvate kinase [Clostridia bacterium]